MATYYATARTNYFRVKDKAAFTTALAAAFPTASLDVVDGYQGDPPGSVAVLERDGYGWPHGCGEGYVIDGHPRPDDDEVCAQCEQRFGDHHDDVTAVIAEHLVDGDVAVLMEVGAEKMRYLLGTAIAVDSTGTTVTVGLDDIYQAAGEKFGQKATVTAVAG